MVCPQRFNSSMTMSTIEGSWALTVGDRLNSVSSEAGWPPMRTVSRGFRSRRLATLGKSARPIWCGDSLRPRKAGISPSACDYDMPLFTIQVVQAITVNR